MTQHVLQRKNRTLSTAATRRTVYFAIWGIFIRICCCTCRRRMKACKNCRFHLPKSWFFPTLIPAPLAKQQVRFLSKRRAFRLTDAPFCRQALSPGRRAFSPIRHTTFRKDFIEEPGHEKDPETREMRFGVCFAWHAVSLKPGWRAPAGVHRLIPVARAASILANSNRHPCPSVRTSVNASHLKPASALTGADIGQLRPTCRAGFKPPGTRTQTARWCRLP